MSVSLPDEDLSIILRLLRNVGTQAVFLKFFFVFMALIIIDFCSCNKDFAALSHTPISRLVV